MIVQFLKFSRERAFVFKKSSAGFVDVLSACHSVLVFFSDVKKDLENEKVMTKKCLAQCIAISVFPHSGSIHVSRCFTHKPRCFVKNSIRGEVLKKQGDVWRTIANG